MIAFFSKCIAPISWIWCGMILGISFLATPAKFLASDLPLGTALDIGRHTFGLFGKAEIVFVLLLAVVIGRFLRAFTQNWVCISTFVLIVTMVFVQQFWLLGVLEDRVLLIMNGKSAPPSYHHLLYAGMELFKVLAVFFLPFSVQANRFGNR